MNYPTFTVGGTCSVIPTRFEPVFAVEGPSVFARVENAPANNAAIAQDFADMSWPPMRRAWFCDAAIAEIGQLFGNGN